MTLVPVLVAGTALLLLVLAEAVVDLVAHRGLYTFRCTVGSLGSLVGNVVATTLLKAGPFLAYGALVDRIALVKLPPSAWTWGVALLGIDLCFYWMHRASHRTQALWVIHEVHHGSEDLNLSTAMRTPWLQGVLATVNFVPLALLGIPTEIFVGAYMVWMCWGHSVHTRLVRRLGPLEWVMVTPSHHRAHHACNPQYLDANYAAMFIVWDRLFGTFVPEEEEPRFGLTHPRAGEDTVRANLLPLAALAGDLRGADSAREAWSRLWEPPEVVARRAPARALPDAPSLGAAAKGAALLALGAAAAAMVGFMVLRPQLSLAGSLGWAALPLLLLALSGHVVDGGRLLPRSRS